MSVTSVSLYKTTDGQTFDNIDAAESHQVSLDNATAIRAYAESYANVSSTYKAKQGDPVGLSGRARSTTISQVEKVISFLMTQGVLIDESYEGIPQSDELVARIAREEAEAVEKAGKVVEVAEVVEAPSFD